MSIPLHQDIHCLSDLQHGEISGLYYDDYVSLGVTYQGPPSAHPRIPNPTPAGLGNQSMRCIPTIAQLKDIQRIDIWYTDDRCMGLMITFTDCRQDSLGRWDERNEGFRQQTVFDRECDSLAIDSMRIALTDHYYNNHVGGGPITLVKSGHYTVSGISVGTRRVGDMAGDKELVVSKNVRTFFSVWRSCANLWQEYLKWEFNHICDQLNKSNVPF